MTDLGTELIAQAFTDLEVDEEWSVREPRGFTFWGSRLPTRVWADPEINDDGFLVTRLHAATALIRGGQIDDASNSTLASAARNAGLSGIVRDSESSKVKLHTSVYVHREVAALLYWLFKFAVVLQAEEASRTAGALASAIGGEPDEAPHPVSGFPAAPDGILGACIRAVEEKGNSPSLWAGKEMLALLKSFQKPPCLLATGDRKGLAAEFPFLKQSGLLTLRTDAPHPTLGSGLLVNFAVPAGSNAEARAELAMTLNRAETRQLTRTHYLGSWGDLNQTVTYSSFLPNVLYTDGFLLNIGMGCVLRANWIAESIFKDDWSRYRGKSALARLLSRLGLSS